MYSNAATVDDYMQEVPEERREALARIRTLCQASLPDYEETIDSGKPVYKKDGDSKVAFSSQEHHIAFYAYEPSVREAYEADFSDPHEGMVQFNKSEAVDFELIEKLLHDTGKANARHAGR